MLDCYPYTCHSLVLAVASFKDLMVYQLHNVQVGSKLNILAVELKNAVKIEPYLLYSLARLVLY